MNNLNKLAISCRYLLWGIVSLWFVAIVVVWLSPKESILMVWSALIGQHHALITVTLTTRLLGILVSLIPLIVIFYIAWLLTRLLNHYQQGEFFTLKNVTLTRKLGFALYFWAISNIVFKTLLSLVLTLSNPVQQKLLTLNISGMDIQSVVIGTVILLLSCVMLEGQKLDEDNKLIP
jgi:hypothetical protein